MVLFLLAKSLTSGDVLATLETVENPDVVGNMLDISDGRLEELKKQSANDTKLYRELIVDHWINSSPWASWENLGGKLVLYGKSEGLEKMKERIKVEKGEYVVLMFLQSTMALFATNLIENENLKLFKSPGLCHFHLTKNIV